MKTNTIWLTVLMGGLLLPLASMRTAGAFEVTVDDSWNSGSGEEGGGEEGGSAEGGGEEGGSAEGGSAEGGDGGGPTAGVCSEGQVCCNVYDDWPSKGKKSCMAKEECEGIGKDVVPDTFCG
jgi:hypothetical protein